MRFRTSLEACAAFAECLQPLPLTADWDTAPPCAAGPRRYDRKSVAGTGGWPGGSTLGPPDDPEGGTAHPGDAVWQARPFATGEAERGYPVGRHVE